MTGSDARMSAVLDWYAKFLREKDLALPKHQPYLVRWVREFLFFAQGHGGYTFEQTLHMFLAEIGGRGDAQPWQIQRCCSGSSGCCCCGSPNGSSVHCCSSYRRAARAGISAPPLKALTGQVQFVKFCGAQGLRPCTQEKAKGKRTKSKELSNQSTPADTTTRKPPRLMRKSGVPP